MAVRPAYTVEPQIWNKDEQSAPGPPPIIDTITRSPLPPTVMPAMAYPYQPAQTQINISGTGWLMIGLVLLLLLRK